MKDLILNPLQANLIQVALTHTYEEFLFLTPNQKDLCQTIIDNLSVEWNDNNNQTKYFPFTNEEIIMITIGVSKWYQEYMDFDDEGCDKEWWENLKVCATQVMDKLLNINKEIK